MITAVSYQIDQLDRDGKESDFVLILGSSAGGDVVSILKLLDLTDGRLREVFVTGECLSGCAEFVQLVNATVHVHDSAVIGFHGNAVTASLLARKFGLPGPFKCFDERADRFRAAMRRRGADADRTARAVIERLEYVSAYEVPSELGDGCRNARHVSRYRFWFPTRDQLREIFGIRLTGRPCSDNLDCLLPYLRERWGDEPGAVIGDDRVGRTIHIPSPTE